MTNITKYLSIIALFFPKDLLSQKDFGIIDYHFIFVDGNFEKQGEGINATLYFDTLRSAFVYGRDESISKNKPTQYQGIVPENFADGMVIYWQDSIGNVIYFDVKTNEYTIRGFADKRAHIYKHKKHKYNWEIQEGKKDILGYSCKKAKINYGCRNYTVWFCPNLPHIIGPWKLVGMPGAILEVEEENQRLLATATKISINSDYVKIKNNLYKPEDGVLVDSKKFYRIMNESRSKRMEKLRKSSSADVKIEVNIKDKVSPDCED
jgi:GLPGLI family protein